MKRLSVLIACFLFISVALPVAAQQEVPPMLVVVQINGTTGAAQQGTASCDVTAVEDIEPAQSAQIQAQKVINNPYQLWAPMAVSHLFCPIIPIVDGFMGNTAHTTIVVKDGGFAAITTLESGTVVTPTVATTITVPITGTAPFGILPLQVISVLPFDEHAYGPSVASPGQEYPENEILDAMNRAKDMAFHGVQIPLSPISFLYEQPIFRSPIGLRQTSDTERERGDTLIQNFPSPLSVKETDT
ncbi:hypothetical protein HY469_01115 [Candidatus Roizmanbacteria bacterium]|nr:hypothetical protein [Candidatus Roizmanbacteria bacterium]